MQFSVATLLAMAAAVTSVSAGCYSTGAKIDNPESWRNSEQLTVACTKLQGNYAGGETRSTCFKASDNLKYDISLKYHKGGYRNIGVNECLDGMRKEFSCERGGKTKYGNWEYRADVNKGQCMDVSEFIY